MIIFIKGSTMKNINIKNMAVVAAAVGLLSACTAQATLVYTTPSGSTTSGGGVNAEADISLSSGQMTITLYNYETSINSVAQCISGISFNITGGSGSTSLVGAPTGTLIDIVSGGSYSTVSGPNSHWGVLNTGGAVNLSIYNVGGAPNDQIIGPVPYTSVNSSVTANHQPMFMGSATFVVDYTGISANSSISNLTFLFGTTPGVDTVAGTPGTPTSVPEPSTVVAGALLLIPLGIQTIRQLRNRRLVAKA